MHPELLPVKVTHLQNAILRKEGIRMIMTLLLCYQARNALLIPEKRPSQRYISRPLKVPPHHQAVLKVWEDQSIIE